jgi:hypothetical protein
VQHPVRVTGFELETGWVIGDRQSLEKVASKAVASSSPSAKASACETASVTSSDSDSECDSDSVEEEVSRSRFELQAVRVTVQGPTHEVYPTDSPGIQRLRARLSRSAGQQTKLNEADMQATMIEGLAATPVTVCVTTCPSLRGV